MDDFSVPGRQDSTLLEAYRSLKEGARQLSPDMLKQAYVTEFAVAGALAERAKGHTPARVTLVDPSVKTTSTTSSIG